MEQMQQANRTSGEQHAVQVTEQVRALLLALSNEQLSLEELMGKAGLKHRPTFLENYIRGQYLSTMWNILPYIDEKSYLYR